MVLPGIQALFGFQLIAVFNARFSGLPIYQQAVHLSSIGLVAVAIALVMTPAAYHRLAHQSGLTQRFITISSRLLLSSMIPLMVAICTDFYLVTTMISHSDALGVGFGLALLAAFGALWFGLPYGARRTR